MLHARGRPRTPAGEPVVAVAAVGARVNAHGTKGNRKRGEGQDGRQPGTPRSLRGMRLAA
jgi:hypothetical protein